MTVVYIFERLSYRQREFDPSTTTSRTVTLQTSIVGSVVLSMLDYFMHVALNFTEVMDRKLGVEQDSNPPSTSSDTPKLALIFIAQKQRYLQKNNSISMYF